MTTACLVLLALASAAPALAADTTDVILLPPIEIRTAARSASVPAAYRHTPLPPYPAAARAQGLEGEVVLTVLIGADGRVVDVHVKTSSGAPVLDDAAALAVKRWTFEPARRGRRAVESLVEVPVKFALAPR